MNQTAATFGILDNRFLSRSIGLLDPPEPVIIGKDASVAEAVALLKEDKVGAVVIVDETGAVAGIFTERDVVLKLDVCEANLDQVPIAERMTVDPHCQMLTHSMAYALNMMSTGGYRHIPLVDENHHPVGVLSVKNIVDYIVQELLRDLETFA
ncbi:MAG: CBS domain-containing protein [Bdellovibrionales bacterium]|nr:CBS domain-containing protein [Bdellovibrionales bacterium]